MNIPPERLAEQLAKRLLPLYVVTGDEPLTALEAQDAVRAAARAAGHTERRVLSVEARFNWATLAESGGNLSLFGDRRLIEIRIPSGKPGVEGARALTAWAAALPPDSVTLVVLGPLDWRSKDSAWFKALANAGGVIEARVIERAALPGWIERRLARAGLAADRAVLEWLADRFEGNLLAAQQEIDKLALTLPPGRVTLADVEAAVVDVSRLEADALEDALLARDAARYARTLADLKDSGEHPVAFLWRLADFVRALLRLQSAVQRGEPLGAAMKAARVWDSRRPLIEKALARLDVTRLERAQAQLALADRQAKGIEPGGEVWDTMLRFGLTLTGPARKANER